MKYLVVAFLFISCAKTIDTKIIDTKTINTEMIDTKLPAQRINNILASTNLIRVIDGSTVSIKLEPYLQCYAHPINQPGIPCDIYISATISMSKPLASGVEIELARINEDGTDGAVVMFKIAPNTFETILNTGFDNHNTQTVTDIYRINKINTFKWVY